MGEVVLPLARLAKVENNQVEGWAILQSPDILFSKHDFQIFSEDEIVEEMDENQNEIKLPSNTSILDTDEYIIDEDQYSPNERGTPAINISCSFKLPKNGSSISMSERQASIVVAQEMIHASSISKESMGMIGS